MSTANQNQQNQQTGPPDIDERPIYDTIDFIYDQGTEGNVAANDTINGSDFTTRESEEGHELASNEVAEVFRVELLPPVQPTGELHTFSHVRLRFEGTDYKHVRYREFMTGFKSPDFKYTTPPLGVPVLLGTLNPDRDPLTTSTPKVAPSDDITPAVTNDGTAIDDNFTVRLHLIRWKGTDGELRDLFNALYGQTTFSQNITMSNPFTGARKQYTRANPVRIEPGADGGSLGQFTKLTGGVDQELPKVYPWATWADTNAATTTNTFFKFDQSLDNVSDPWKELEFDFTDQKDAAIFNYVQVNSPDALQDAKFVIDERDRNPILKLPATSRHQLPTLYPMTAPNPTVPIDQERSLSDDELPVAFGTTLDPAGRRIGSNLLGGKQVIWDDGGGFRIRDNGNSIASGDAIVGVQGRRLELQS